MRIEPISTQSIAWYLKPFFWSQRRRYGKVLDAALLWARSPRLFLGVGLKTATLLRRGASLEKVSALCQWRDSSLFDERERSALEYSEAMTLSGIGVEDLHIAALRRHFTDDASIVFGGVDIAIWQVLRGDAVARPTAAAQAVVPPLDTEPRLRI